MRKFFILIISLIFICTAFSFIKVRYARPGQIDYVRVYDLGGGGLKTALLSYDRNSQTINWIESQVQLGQCPDDMEVCDWIRLRMHEILGRDLDTEIRSGYLFGFSLAGLDKLRSKPLATTDVSILFQLPSNKISCIDDGSAHLVASMKTLESKLPKGSIWNFSIGTGVGFGFTDSNHTMRNPSDFIEFFDHAPWHVTEPLTGLDVTFACSGLAFDKIVTHRNGTIDDRVFLEFASRWKAFIHFKILEYSKIISPNKHWGTPVAIIFTGGHIDMYGDCLVDALHELNIDIPVFTGPKNAGLLGAAWNAITVRECG